MNCALVEFVWPRDPRNARDLVLATLYNQEFLPRAKTPEDLVKKATQYALPSWITYNLPSHNISANGPHQALASTRPRIVKSGNNKSEKVSPSFSSTAHVYVLRTVIKYTLRSEGVDH